MIPSAKSAVSSNYSASSLWVGVGAEKRVLMEDDLDVLNDDVLAASFATFRFE